jgi:ADP-ribose pyrophosphatase YjhB (NUDIX family)
MRAMGREQGAPVTRSSRDGRTRDTALYRPSARAVVLDPDARILLVLSEFDGKRMWFTPGGELDEGETPEQAILRELREEVGLTNVTLGPHIWHRRAIWRHEERDTWYTSEEWFYLVRLAEPPLEAHALPEGESIVRLREARWWPLPDLEGSDDLVSPRALRELLAPLVRGEVPAEPVEIGL